jgi:outer membrane protein TolC
MTMTRSARLATALAAVLFASVSPAETLDEAWAKALRQDRGLAAVRGQAEAAGLDAEAARAQRWPTLGVQGSYTKLDDAPAFDFSFTGLPIRPPEIFKNDQFMMGSATLTVPIFTSGRISGSIAAAEARSKGAGATAVGAEADTKLAVADAYVGVLRAQKALAVAQSNVASLESVAHDVESMFERELVPKNDLLAVQVALADARQVRLRADNGLEIARARYNRHLGEPMDRPVELAEVLPVPAELPAGIDALIEQALRQRTELAALDQQSQAYHAMAKAERSRVLPQLSLVGGYNYLENQFLDDEEFLSAGIGVQWALFDGGQTRKRAAALDRTGRATEDQRRDVESLIALQVRQAWLGVAESQERMKVSATAVEQAEENLRIAREQYGSGLGTQTQLLQAEALRVNALGNRDNATLDASLARLRLARAVGAL